MVRALAPDRADQAFNISILPRRAERCWPVPDPHRSHASLERGTECSVIVANQIFRCTVPGKRFGDLARQPLGRRMRVTANHSNRRRSCPRTRNAKSCWNAIVRTTNSLGHPKQRHAPTSAFTPRSRAQKVADLHKNPRIDRSDDVGLAEVGSRISF